ncbi:MAG: ABC transporter ATP-binding protein [Oscillatoriales cyanobacterium RU_3_3]|nr:ABC transporter ATP-binding protein [Oscillatoriales cyanobacterium RU_3_3]
MNSILIVQAFGRERYEEKRFESQSEKTSGRESENGSA